MDLILKRRENNGQQQRIAIVEIHFQSIICLHTKQFMYTSNRIKKSSKLDSNLRLQSSLVCGLKYCLVNA